MSDQIYITIAKSLNGEASEAEQEEVRKWLAASQEHVAEYEELKHFWQKTDEVLQVQPVFDTAAAWNKVAAKTIQQQPRVEQVAAKKRIAFPAWAKMSLAAAAALLIAVFISREMSGPAMVTAMAADDNIEVVLPDNSHITLRKGSTLKYPKAFAANERHVALEGEAFFEVTRNEKQPFIIDAQSSTVQVLGTSFNVKAEENTSSVVVATGKVSMTSSRDASKSLILTPGEKGSLLDGNMKEETVNAGNYLFWKTGIIKFEEQPLEQVVKELREINDVNINLDMPETNKQQRVNISFGKQPVEEMLTELCLITGSHWSKEGDTYNISPKG